MPSDFPGTWDCESYSSTSRTASLGIGNGRNRYFPGVAPSQGSRDPSPLQAADDFLHIHGLLGWEVRERQRTRRLPGTEFRDDHHGKPSPN